MEYKSFQSSSSSNDSQKNYKKLILQKTFSEINDPDKLNTSQQRSCCNKQKKESLLESYKTKQDGQYKLESGLYLLKVAMFF